MNKYVVRTSLVWLFVLIAVGGVVEYRSRHREEPVVVRQDSQILASGPEAQTATGAPDASPTQQQTDSAMAPVTLSADQRKAIGVATGTVEYKQITDDIRASGTVSVDERSLSYVQVRFSGYIRKVFADANYDYVRKGQPLFTIYSPDLVATQREYLLARQSEKAMSGSSVEGVASGASALSSAAEQRLRQWDMPQAELLKLEQTGKPLPDLTITSQVAGFITERNAVPNLYVEPSTRLYTVADLSRVWVNAQVFQNDVGRVKPGDPVSITVDSYAGKIFRGRVEQILPQVDMTTRTAQVRVVVQNSGVKLKPGMFVNVGLKSALGRQLTVPASAVFQTGMRQLVFIDQGDGTFAPVPVVLGSTAGSDVIVLSGLQPHQRIVTSANFLLDSESQLRAAAGAPASATPSTLPAATTQPSAAIEFTTEPAPPRKGSNVFRVRLKDANGKAIDGADVTVTFYMPAMPAMGMAAMKTETKLAAKSGGLYEGAGELGSGGSWQVTITALQKGRTLAVKQMRIDATGGM